MTGVKVQIKNGKCVQTIFLYFRWYFEISVYEISRVDYNIIKLINTCSMAASIVTIFDQRFHASFVVNEISINLQN